MSEGSQTQRAGSHSNQYQFYGNVTMVGVSEERAHEISRQNFRDLYAQYSVESHPVANKRVEKLDEMYIKQLVEEGLLEVLADPAFQVTLRKAQLGAASTERDADHEILASLLLDRAERGTNRPIRAGINRAVEIVDQLDDEALTGLTVFSAASILRSRGYDLNAVLDTMDQMLEQLMEESALPSGSEWIEHLEILDTVRTFQFGNFVDFQTFWSDKFSSWLVEGVPEGSDEDVRGRAALAKFGASDLVVPNELKPGYSMFAMDPTETSFKSRGESCWHPNVCEQIRSIGRDIYGSEKKDESLVPAFMDLVRKRPYQRACEDWWKNIPVQFSLTTAGKVIARANLKNLDKLGILPAIW